MSLRERVIVLDFDGVVWDSVDESFEQAWTAWQRLNGASRIPHDDARRLFRAARWQCKDGHDFCIVMDLLEQGRTDVGDLSAEAFRELRATLASGPTAQTFVREFYACREHMRKTDFAKWCGLQRPFPGVVEQIAQMRVEALGVAVATTKDTDSARALLEYAGIRGLTIFGREVSLDKRVHMQAIAAQFGVPMPHLAFVEDLLENLLHVRDLGVRLVLADWGYNTADERRRALDDGVTVVSLDSFARTLRET